MRLLLSCALLAVVATAGAVVADTPPPLNGRPNQTLLTVSQRHPAPQTRKKHSSPVFVVLGSSTAAGTGANPIDSAWVWRFTAYALRRDPTAKVINLAVGGYTTYDIMPTGFTPPPGRQLPKEGHNITKALTYHPDVLIINLPSNDAANDYSVREQLANYAVITAQVTDPKTHLFVSTTQPRNFTKPGQLKIQMDMRDSTYSRFGSRTMDFWTGLANPDGTMKAEFNSGDGIHLNNAGHRILLQRALAAGVWRVMATRHAAGE